MRLSEALLAYSTTFKTFFGMFTYEIIFGKFCHLHGELEPKTLWIIKQLKFDHDKTRVHIKLELDESEKILNDA